MKFILSVWFALAVLGHAAEAQSSTTPPATLPHPPTPSLIQIESQARMGARRPGDRPRTMSKADRKRLAALRKPDPEDEAKYAQFLTQEGTGLVRMYPDADCVQKNIVRVDGECASYVTGASGVSFRKGSDVYDIRMAGGQLIGDGFFSLVILTDLGAVDLNTACPWCAKERNS